MIISISGLPGSGKSVVAEELARRLGLDHLSAGDFMREMAEERGLTILELSREAETSAAIDHEIDARTRRLGETRGGFVIDSRLAWHFLPSSVKVFLDVRPDVAAARVYDDGRGAERENVDLAATQRAIEERLASERLRYEEYYGVDSWIPPTSTWSWTRRTAPSTRSSMRSSSSFSDRACFTAAVKSPGPTAQGDPLPAAVVSTCAASALR